MNSTSNGYKCAAGRSTKLGKYPNHNLSSDYRKADIRRLLGSNTIETMKTRLMLRISHRIENKSEKESVKHHQNLFNINMLRLKPLTDCDNNDLEVSGLNYSLMRRYKNGNVLLQNTQSRQHNNISSGVLKERSNHRYSNTLYSNTKVLQKSKQFKMNSKHKENILRQSTIDNTNRHLNISFEKRIDLSSVEKFEKRLINRFQTNVVCDNIAASTPIKPMDIEDSPVHLTSIFSKKH